MPKQQSDLLFCLWQHQCNVKKTDAAVEKASDDDDEQQKVSISTGAHQALNLTCQCLRRATDTPPFDFAFFEHTCVGKNENSF